MDENIVYSVDDKPEKIDKKVLKIFNPFQININDTKIVKALYKKLENIVRYKLNEKLNIVEKNFLSFMDELAIDEDVMVEYEQDVDVLKLFSAFGISYKVSDNYLENLVNYIKVYNELFNNSLVISFGLLNLLSDDEILLLTKELQFLDLNLIDITYNSNHNIKDLIIDQDWCII